MNLASIEAALRLLSNTQATPASMSRELIVAYALIAAWIQHWPSQKTELAEALLKKFTWVREMEPDRYIKQRRIAIARLASEFAA